LATSAATAVHTTLDRRHGLQIYQKAVPRRQQTHLKTTCREIMSCWCLTWSAQAMPDHIHIEEEALFCGIARLVSAPPLGSCYFTILPRFNSSPESQLLVYYCRKRTVVVVITWMYVLHICITTPPLYISLWVMPSIIYSSGVEFDASAMNGILVYCCRKISGCINLKIREKYDIYMNIKFYSVCNTLWNQSKSLPQI
jgi:hypothetical protein